MLARPSRRELGLVAGVLSVTAYNWWAAVPFHHGLLPSTDGLFSDLEAPGHPDASILYHLDLVAGLLLIAAVLLAGDEGHRRSHLERSALLGFGVAGALGGQFRYACAEGVSATCRHLEWHLQLPLHHYVHVLSGVAEFVTIPFVLREACRRTKGDGTAVAGLYRALSRVLALGYALLVVAYLTDRYGVLAEPICFVTFSAVVLTELAERPVASEAPPAPSRRRSRSR